MSQLPTTHRPHEFTPAPHNFDPHTGTPIEYDEHGHPYSPIRFVVAPTPPEGVAGYDPYTGTPLDEHGNVVEGIRNPFGQHDFRTRLEDRAGVDPSGHVIAQRPVYDESTGLKIFYDEHGNPNVHQPNISLPEGVVRFDPWTGEGLDEHGNPVHDRPAYDTDTGLPITYDGHGNPLVPNVHVEPIDGVASYDPRTGEPLDAHGKPVEGVENPHQRLEDRTYGEHESGLPNFDPETGFPLEYDEHGHPHPAVDLGYTPALPDGVAGYDPDTGVPVDAHGKPVEGVENPHGGHTFTTRVEDREGVDPSGHVIAQRPAYDEDTGLPIYYDDKGTGYVPNVDTTKPEGVSDYDPRTGEPLDEFGNVVTDATNPHQRPAFDTANGRPVTYDQNGYPAPQPHVYYPPQPGVASYDPRTGDPLDAHGERIPGVENPWKEPVSRVEDDVQTAEPEVDEPTPVEVADDRVTTTRDDLGPTPDGRTDEHETDEDRTDEDGTGDGDLGEKGDAFGEAERPVDPTGPESGAPVTATTTEPATGGTTVPEPREPQDPFAHVDDGPGTGTSPTTDAVPERATTERTDDTPALRDEPASHEPAVTGQETAGHEAAGHDAGAPDTAPADHLDTVDA